MQQGVLIINAIIIFFFGEAAYVGYRKGLLNSLIPFITLALTFILLNPLCKVVEPYIGASLEETIKYVASASISVAKEKVSVSGDMPEGAAKEITAKAEDTIENIANSSVATVSAQIVRFVVLIISNLIFRAIIYLIFGGFATIGNLPIVANVNQLGGSAVAVIGRYIEMCLIMTMLTLIGTAFPAIKNMYDYMMLSVWIKMIVKYNIINIFI